MITRLHEWALGRVQALYDTLRDAHGLYVGTFRLAAWTTAWAIFAVWTSLTILRPLVAVGWELAVMLGGVPIAIMIVAALTWPQHQMEREQQAIGKVEMLNAISVRDATRIGRMVTFYGAIFLVGFPLLEWGRPVHMARWACLGLLLIGYAYTRGVVVRPRDEERFCKLAPNFA